jgi:hypothetical protein
VEWRRDRSRGADRSNSYWRRSWRSELILESLVVGLRRLVGIVSSVLFGFRDGIDRDVVRVFGIVGFPLLG